MAVTTEVPKCAVQVFFLAQCCLTSVFHWCIQHDMAAGFYRGWYLNTRPDLKVTWNAEFVDGLRFAAVDAPADADV